MEITWLAHSCFRLRGAAVSILTDPFPASLGGTVAGVEPDIVTVSSIHPNHSAVASVDGDFRLLEGPGEYGVAGVYVNGVMTPPPTNPDTPPPPRNTAYLFEMEGLRLCHLGDLAHPLSNKLVEDLTPLDVLFVPVGGRCTLPPDRLSALIHGIEPRIVIPMHYRVPGAAVELDTIDAFLREMSVRDAEERPRLSVTTTTLPANTTVTLLKPTALPS